MVHVSPASPNRGAQLQCRAPHAVMTKELLDAGGRFLPVRTKVLIDEGKNFLQLELFSPFSFFYSHPFFPSHHPAHLTTLSTIPFISHIHHNVKPLSRFDRSQWDKDHFAHWFVH